MFHITHNYSLQENFSCVLNFLFNVNAFPAAIVFMMFLLVVTRLCSSLTCCSARPPGGAGVRAQALGAVSSAGLHSFPRHGACRPKDEGVPVEFITTHLRDPCVRCRGGWASHMGAHCLDAAWRAAANSTRHLQVSLLTLP